MEVRTVEDIKQKTKDYLYKRFNNFEMVEDYEAAATFIFNLYKGSTTVSIDRYVLEYICENYDEIYLDIIKCKY